MAVVCFLSFALAVAAEAQTPATIPTALACGTSASTSIALSWASGGAAVSLHDINVASSAATAAAFPFLSVSATGSTGVVHDLLPATAYWFKLRAHSAAAGPTQMMLGWSNFTASIVCKTAAVKPGAVRNVRRVGSATARTLGVAWDAPAGKPSGWSCTHAVVSHRADAAPGAEGGAWHTLRPTSSLGATSQSLETLVASYAVGSAAWLRVECDGVVSDAVLFRNIVPRGDTLYIEPLRVAEQQLRVPDYLANHNSGTLQGDVGFLTAAGGSPAPSPGPTRPPTPGHFFDWQHSPRVKVRFEFTASPCFAFAVSRHIAFPPLILLAVLRGDCQSGPRIPRERGDHVVAVSCHQDHTQHAVRGLRVVQRRTAGRNAANVQLQLHLRQLHRPRHRAPRRRAAQEAGLQ